MAVKAKAKTKVKTKPTAKRLFPVIVEPMEEGGYYAACPVLQGCHVEGETCAEALENLEDVIRIVLEWYREVGKPIPELPTSQGSLTIWLPIAIPVEVSK